MQRSDPQDRSTPPEAPEPSRGRAQGANDRRRLNSIDYVRGLAIIFMALDHVRAAFAGHGISKNLEVVSNALFFTRWMTHFCAPTFILLAGSGAYLSLGRGHSKEKVTFFLWTRGLWLVFLDLIAINSSFNFHVIGLGVLWAIGWSMVLLAGGVWLPRKVLLGGSVLMVLGHNMFDGVTNVPWQDYWLWTVAYTGGSVEWMPNYVLRIQYPIVPWVGVMAIGYCFGHLLTQHRQAQARTFILTGGWLTALYVLLRAINVYGDPERWYGGHGLRVMILSFLNCEKYPPSLLFLLMALGPALIVLGMASRYRLPGSRLVTIFGRVPLFFYLLHLPVIRLMAKAAKGLLLPEGSRGFDLWVVYVVWGIVILLLFPLCSWYDRARGRYRWRIMRYI